MLRMKGPSLDAIRRFKEQQNREKREQEEQKVQAKLSTLEHRAAQGDKKAKSQLKQIEKVQEERKRPSNTNNTGNQRQHDSRHSGRNGEAHSSHGDSKKITHHARKPKAAETDFEELMRLAKNNNNEVKCPDKTPKQQKKKAIVKLEDEKFKSKASSQVESRNHRSNSKGTAISNRPPSQETRISRDSRPIVPTRPIAQSKAAIQSRPMPPSRPVARARIEPQARPMLDPRARPQHYPPTRQPPSQHMRRYYQDEEDHDDEEEDDYESDGFVVNEGDDEAQDELSKTLKSLFRYDKRRCDMREQEVERQYRRIGNVSTFEDLEREERRASRLAASEDARALRDEEERKRLKKIRLKNSRD